MIAGKSHHPEETTILVFPSTSVVALKKTILKIAYAEALLSTGVVWRDKG